MSTTNKHRAFPTKKLTYLDHHHTEMDRVLTALFARLAHNGYPSRLRRKANLMVETFVEEFLDHPEFFTGFGEHREILDRWVETHLMDVVNRGKAQQVVAAPRPLHGFTYRFRNPKHSRDYGAAQQIFETLYYARKGSGQAAIEHLTRFFFQGHDKVTGKADGGAVLDVETQALLRLMELDVGDAPDTKEGRESFPPVCIGAADLLAEDIKRLLFYERHIPRSVMVDYLKVLLAFHLGLMQLRAFKLLPALVKRKSADPICAPTACPMDPRRMDDPHGDCPYRIGLFVDVAAQPESASARLATHSADVHYRRIPLYVRAHFTVKKLDEFGESLIKIGKLPRPKGEALTVADLLQLLDTPYKEERARFFGGRMHEFQDTKDANDEKMIPRIKEILALNLPEYDTYLEIILARWGGFHRQYITECMDSLLMKNRPGALLAQGRTKGASRRFILDSRLLEVLLQIAVLRQDTPGGPFYTRELRIEDLLGWLRERYGLHIDRLPRGDGFGVPSIEDRQALRENAAAFTNRLREVGFYRDLSDAYVSQTVVPRYRILPNGGGGV